jgi:hypothetical protein
MDGMHEYEMLPLTDNADRHHSQQSPGSSPESDRDLERTAGAARQPNSATESLSITAVPDFLQDGHADEPRYAREKLLSRYIPGASSNVKSFRLRLSKRASMLRLQLSLALITCVINIALTAWAYSVDVPQNGVGTFYTGDCTWTARLNSGAHVVLNAFSSLFLGAGNYCMQILVAPSPGEVRNAHSRDTTYDIGTQSLRNFLQIRRTSKKVLWVAIGILSTLLHLM